MTKPRPFSDPRYTPARMSEPDRAAVQSGALDVLAYLGTGENPDRPAHKKPERHEDKLHRAIYVFSKSALPADASFVTWESRGGGMMQGAERKSRGQVRGWFDAGVFWRQTAIFFEIKAPKGVVSPEQHAVHARYRLLGFRVFVVRSLEEYADALQSCGMELRGRVMA